MNSAIKDLQQMVDIMKDRGYPSNLYELHAPVSYARTLHAELQLRGITVTYPGIGDEMHIELQNRAKITVYAH